MLSYILPTSRCSHLRGFTLVELMVTLSVLAVLLALATPSMGRMLADWQVNSAVNAFSGGLSQARSEAIKTGRPITLCVSTDRQTCSATGDWGDGWILFLDANGNGAFDNADDQLITAQGAGRGLASAASDSTTSPRAFRFMPTGLLATGAATVTFTPKDSAIKKRSAAVNRLGRLSITQS